MNIGDRVQNTMRDREGYICGFEDETMALVDYGRGPEISSVKYLKTLGRAPSSLAIKRVKQTREERLRRAEVVSDDFLEYLRAVGVSIRVYCAEEHIGLLADMLEHNGANLSSGFEPSDTHSRGGEYRPYAPGIICIFPAPETGRFPTPFSLTSAGEGHIARTAFGLKLISSGFPITTWKGQKSNAGGVVCPEASL